MQYKACRADNGSTNNGTHNSLRSCELEQMFSSVGRMLCTAVMRHTMLVLQGHQKRAQLRFQTRVGVTVYSGSSHLLLNRPLLDPL